jgi:type IV fimbrial biogenesis protein FimT
MVDCVKISNHRVANRLADQCGFTLSELLVTVAIFAILATIAVPQFLALQPRFRLDGATRQVFSELMSARMKAVNENTTYTVTFPTNHTIQIVGAASKVVDLQTLYKTDVTLSSTQATIQFSSRGTANVSPNITITNSAGTKTVSLKITGSASIS